MTDAEKRELDARIKERNRRVLDEIHDRIGDDIDTFVRVTGAHWDGKSKDKTHGKHRGIICPNSNCKSGTGPNGTGPTMQTGKPGHVFCVNCKSMDAVDVIQTLDNCSWTDALRTAADRLGIPWDDIEPNKRDTHTTRTASTHRRDNPTKAPQDVKPAKLADPIPDYADYLKRAQAALTADSDGARYLQSRGIDLLAAQRVGIGYDSAWRHPSVPDTIPTSPRIIVPMDTGGYETRDIRPDDELERIGGDALRYKKQSVQPKGLFNSAALQQTEPVHIVEGWADALAVISAGGRAVSLNSTSGRSQLIERLDTMQPEEIPPLILACDPDTAGREARDILAEYLDGRDIEYRDGTICLTGPDDVQLDPAASREYDPPRFADAVRADVSRAATPQATLDAIDAVGPDALHSAFSNAAAMMLTGVPHIPTGIGPFDDQLDGGLYAGLILLGGRTGAGKTTFALNIADNIAATGRPVLYVALEMSAFELYAKSMARIARDIALENGRDVSPSYAAIMRGALRWDIGGAVPIAKYASTIARHMYIYEHVGHTSSQAVRETAEMMRLAHGTAPIVILDYLQIMGADDPRMSDKQAADANVLGLKQLSRDLDTPVIVISSLNRASYGPTGKQPISEASFKESGGIEYGADVLLGIERTDTLGPDSEIREVQIVMLKNRRGPCNPATGYKFRPGPCTFTPYPGAVRRYDPTAWTEPDDDSDNQTYTRGAARRERARSKRAAY